MLSLNSLLSSFGTVIIPVFSTVTDALWLQVAATHFSGVCVQSQNFGVKDAFTTAVRKALLG
jgi:hypothetical protein